MTNEPPGDDGEWLRTCRQVIRHLIAQFQWTLVAEEELLAVVLTRLPTACSQTSLKQAIIHIYAGLLYAACRQTSDGARRERAFTDLAHFLYRFAAKRMPERAEDLVNQTLLLVYEQLDDCREPGAFLRFAWWKLRAVIKRVQQQDQALFALPDDDEHGFLMDSSQGPEEQALHAEQRHLIFTTIQQFLNPREQQIILLTFVNGFSDRDIAEQLNLSAANVRVIRHRALDKLRRNLNIEGQFSGKGGE